MEPVQVGAILFWALSCPRLLHDRVEQVLRRLSHPQRDVDIYPRGGSQQEC